MCWKGGPVWKRAFAKEIENLINNTLVGNDINPFTWSLPIEQSRDESNRKVLGKIHLDNTRTRKMMQALDQVVDVCVVDENRINKWKYIDITIVELKIS